MAGCRCCGRESTALSAMVAVVVDRDWRCQSSSPSSDMDVVVVVVVVVIAVLSRNMRR